MEDTKYNEIDNIYESNILYDEKPLIIKTSKMILNDMEYTSGKLSNLIFEFPDSSDEFYKFLLDLDKVLKNKIITIFAVQKYVSQYIAVGYFGYVFFLRISFFIHYTYNRNCNFRFLF